MMKLKRSKDRKVANMVTPNGKQASIANTFGLPAGKAFACPNATAFCEKICYAGKLEKIFKGSREVLMHNWNALKDATYNEMYDMLSVMVKEFRAECEKRNAPKLFRIHWDGDFFNAAYIDAWHDVILYNDDVQFWVYTRVPAAAEKLTGIANISVYFSSDPDNVETAKTLQNKGIRIAHVAKNFAEGREAINGVRCPENNKKIPLISQRGSACVSCGQCVFARNDILFSVSKK